MIMKENAKIFRKHSFLKNYSLVLNNFFFFEILTINLRILFISLTFKLSINFLKTLLDL